MADEVYVKNTISGVVGTAPRHYLEHPILGANLIEVRNGKRRKSLKDLVDEANAEDESVDEPEANPETNEGETAETDKKDD